VTFKRLSLVVTLVAAGCSSSREETWIGSNVDVAIDSKSEPPPIAPR
jgi:hypothetical protein